MKNGFAAVLILLTALGSYGSPAGSGGGGSSSSDDSNLEGWFALGAAALVAGILIWDVIRDSRAETADDTIAALEGTGVDWTALSTHTDEAAVLGISVFPGTDGLHLARYFQKLLLPLEDRGFVFGGEPLNLGSISLTEQAAMAEDFLGINWFIASDEGSLYLFTGGAEPVWERTLSSWDSLSVRNAAADFLGAVPSL